MDLLIFWLSFFFMRGCVLTRVSLGTSCLWPVGTEIWMLSVWSFYYQEWWIYFFYKWMGLLPGWRWKRMQTQM